MISMPKFGFDYSFHQVAALIKSVKPSWAWPYTVPISGSFHVVGTGRSGETSHAVKPIKYAHTVHM